MANTKSAAKRARQTERRTLNNRRALTAVKTSLKSVRAVIASGKPEEAKAAAAAFVSTIDKATKTGRVHKNSANRHKGVIAKALAALKYATGGGPPRFPSFAKPGSKGPGFSRLPTITGKMEEFTTKTRRHEGGRGKNGLFFHRQDAEAQRRMSCLVSRDFDPAAACRLQAAFGFAARLRDDAKTPGG